MLNHSIEANIRVKDGAEFSFIVSVAGVYTHLERLPREKAWLSLLGNWPAGF